MKKLVIFRRVGAAAGLFINLFLLRELSCFYLAASKNFRRRCELFFARICFLLVAQILAVSMVQLHCSYGVRSVACYSKVLCSITADLALDERRLPGLLVQLQVVCRRFVQFSSL